MVSYAFLESPTQTPGNSIHIHVLLLSIIKTVYTQYQMLENDQLLAHIVHTYQCPACGW